MNLGNGGQVRPSQDARRCVVAWHTTNWNAPTCPRILPGQSQQEELDSFSGSDHEGRGPTGALRHILNFTTTELTLRARSAGAGTYAAGQEMFGLVSNSIINQ